MKRNGRELQLVGKALPGRGPVSNAAISIGFVGMGSSAGLGDSLAALIPPEATLEVLTIAEASRRIAAHDLTVLIVAVDARSWRQTVVELRSIIDAATAHPVAVFALVPRDDPAALVKAFELRVADVGGLPIDRHEVRARLAALVRRRRVAFAKAAETRAAWQLATIDPVTKLFNRTHLTAILPAEFDSARKLGQPLAVMMIDLDGLKALNDRWGHAAGDKVLRNVAGAIGAGMRLTDTIARFGGDEIVVVMPDTPPDVARALAARLVQRVAQLNHEDNRDAPMLVTISVGLAVCEPRDADSEALLRRADEALYVAKHGGRNRVATAA